MLLDKIKNKYYQNLITNFMEIGDVHEIKKILEKFKSQKNLENNLFLQNIIFSLLEKEKFSKVFNKNLVWVNSFDQNDNTYINGFLKFIFDKNDLLHKDPTLYSDYLNQISSNNVNFESLTRNSYLYQFLISEITDSLIILNSSGAFFETHDKKYFTHYFFSSCYFYIVNNPVTIYKRRKLLNPQADVDENYFGLTQSDTNYINSHNYQSKVIEENKHNWSTNVASWTNHNVISTFKGYIINFEDLMKDPKQILAEICAHLIQAGLDISLNYLHIDEFLESNSITNEKYQNIEVSNKELKILSRDNASVGKKFRFF